jgi:hypothetical protein
MLTSGSWKSTKPFRQLRDLGSFVRALGFARAIALIRSRQFLMRLHLRRHVAILERSGLFDEAWYLERYPDVAGFEMSAMRHYLLFGAAEGRDPSPLFDTSWYLENYPDVAKRGLNPFVHYLVRGAIEGRHPRSPWEARAETARGPEVIRRHGGTAPVLAVRALPPRVHTEANGSARSGGPWLVCVSHVRPDPPRAGNAYRLQRLLGWASRSGFRVLLIHAPLPGDEPSTEEMDHLAAIYPDLVVCRRNGRVDHSLPDARGAAAAIDRLAGRPPRSFVTGSHAGDDARAENLRSIERAFAHDSLIEVVLAVHEALRPTIVLVTYVFMTRMLPLLDSGTLRVLDTIDVFSRRPANVTRYGVRDTLALTPEEETSYLARADVIVAIQAEEAAALRRLVPDKRIVMAGVDFDVLALPPAPQSRVVLLIASGNAMNVKGVEDFLRFAWPLVRRRVPDAEFWMAGQVSEAVRSVNGGVKPLGQVDDLDRLYRSARVIINPAVAGTGSKIKTLESLSRFRPVVCWPAGVEGLELELGQHCRVVANWYEFAARVVEQLEADPSLDERWPDPDRLAKLLSADTVYADLGVALSQHPGRH